VNCRNDRWLPFRRTARVRRPSVQRTLTCSRHAVGTAGELPLQPARSQTAATAPASSGHRLIMPVKERKTRFGSLYAMLWSNLRQTPPSCCLLVTASAKGGCSVCCLQEAPAATGSFAASSKNMSAAQRLLLRTRDTGRRFLVSSWPYALQHGCVLPLPRTSIRRHSSCSIFPQKNGVPEILFPSEGARVVQRQFGSVLRRIRTYPDVFGIAPGSSAQGCF
jgi:hypothetical protein